MAMQIPALNQITENLTKKLQEGLTKGLDTANQNAQQLKDLGLEQVSESIQTVNKLTENSLSQFTEKTSQLINRITNATSTLEKSFHTYFEQVDNLNHNISQSIQTSISSSLGKWIDNYPQLIWAVNHPLQAFGLFLFILFMLSGLIAAGSRMTEKFWVFLFIYPFKLIAFIARLILTTFNKNNEKSTNSTATETQIKLVISRLEANKQEHNLLLQELKILLNPK
jgi:hypothetical protein